MSKVEGFFLSNRVYKGVGSFPVKPGKGDRVGDMVRRVGDVITGPTLRTLTKVDDARAINNAIWGTVALLGLSVLTGAIKHPVGKIVGAIGITAVLTFSVIPAGYVGARRAYDAYKA
jgi:hypothetical protein